MSTTKKLGLAWMLGAVQRHTEMDIAKELREDKVGDAKDTSPVYAIQCKYRKKPQASPQWSCAQPSLTPYTSTGLDLQSSVAC